MNSNEGGNIASKVLLIGTKGSRLQHKRLANHKKKKKTQEGILTEGIINHTARDNQKR